MIWENRISTTEKKIASSVSVCNYPQDKNSNYFMQLLSLSFICGCYFINSDQIKRQYMKLPLFLSLHCNNEKYITTAI